MPKWIQGIQQLQHLYNIHHDGLLMATMGRDKHQLHLKLQVFQRTSSIWESVHISRHKHRCNQQNTVPYAFPNVPVVIIFWITLFHCILSLSALTFLIMCVHLLLNTYSDSIFIRKCFLFLCVWNYFGTVLKNIQ